MNKEEIRHEFSNKDNYYYGHGTGRAGWRAEEVANLILKNGLRLSGGTLDGTTLGFGRGSEQLFEKLENTLNNWKHEDSKYIIIASIPQDYYIYLTQFDGIEDRPRAYCQCISSDDGQKLGMKQGWYLRPEFVRGIYNANDRSFIPNERYYENLSTKEQKVIFDLVKKQYISMLRNSEKSLAQYAEICKNLNIKMPLTEDEIEQADKGYFDENNSDEKSTSKESHMRSGEIQKVDENGNRILHEYINPELLKRKIKLPNGREIPAKQYIQENLFDYIPESGTFTLKSNGGKISVKQYIEKFIMFELGNEKYNGDLEALLRDTVVLDEPDTEREDSGDDKTSRKQKNTIYGTTIAQDREAEENEQQKRAMAEGQSKKKKQEENKRQKDIETGNKRTSEYLENLNSRSNNQTNNSRREGSNPEACRRFRESLKKDFRKAGIVTNEITRTQRNMLDDRNNKRNQRRGMGR